MSKSTKTKTANATETETKTETPAEIASNPQPFTKNFLVQLRRVLDSKTTGGVAVTREQVCQELGLDSKIFQGTISALVNSGQLEGYEIKRGSYGGIGKVGEKHKLPEGVRAARPRKEESFSPEFVKLVSDTLEAMTEESPEKYVRRLDVAKAMGMPGSDTEDAISLALSSGKVPGYESKRGAGGGIRRAQPGAEPAAKVEPAAEVSPASARPEIFNNKNKTAAKTKKAA
jgi:hypothetical protein